MDNEYAKHETEYIEKYQKEGYSDNFRIEDDKLISSETKKKYAAEEVIIVGEHRFEGMSNPSDLSILYALKTKDDAKGTLLTAYGPEADTSIHYFIENIPKENRQTDINEPPVK